MSKKLYLHSACNKTHIGIVLTDGSFSFGGGDADRIQINGEPAWWLARLVVREQVRRQGWGTKIIEEIKKHLLGFPLIVTPGGYDDDDERREKFYKSVGFKWSEDREYMIFNN